MRKNGKKLLSLVLALVMCLTLVPVSALAKIINEHFDIENGVLIRFYRYSGDKDAGSAVTIPDDVTSIGDYAFERYSNLISVTIPNSVTSIGEWAFYYCTSLTSIDIPNSVNSIGAYAFNDCTSLTSINIPSSVTNIGESAFSHCTSLESMSIPGSVTKISSSMFFGCTSLTSVSISGGVISIGELAFAFCESLTSVSISDSVTNIGNEAFCYCTNLSDVYYGGTQAQWNAITIGDENEPLKNANIHFSGTEEPATYTITFNPNGGSVYPTSKTVTAGETYGELPTPTRDSYSFDGWYTSANGGSRVTSGTTVDLTEDQTLYAHWTSAVDPYNLGDETYSFENFGDSDSPGGHCFGMSMTSAGYYNNLLDIRRIGGNANTPLHSFTKTQTVKQPICYYQKIQGTYSARSIVAGGSSYLSGKSNIASDWQEVVNYVRGHSYDDTGLLQIGYRKNNEGGHAINFLRYENVNGQDRIYAYDNNFPTQETYFYRDSSGSVRQAPVQTFSGAIDCISLRDCRTYFDIVGDFDATHVLYMAENAAAVEGYTYSYMEAAHADEEYIMYELPSGVDRVTIIPNIDNATFIYMDKEYSFGKITDETRGEFMLASADEGAAGTDASFRIYEDDSAASTQFTDVPANSWYYDAVYWAVDKDIVSGTSPTTFTPNRTCTTTEIVTLLWHAAGRPASTAQLPFTLNARLGFAEGALRWAYEEGIIDAAFDQTAPCTRAGAAKFLWQAFGSPATAVANSFTDVPAGAGYAPAVAWAAGRGIIKGTSSTTFTPDTTCTRAEIVTLLYRAYK